MRILVYKPLYIVLHSLILWAAITATCLWSWEMMGFEEYHYKALYGIVFFSTISIINVLIIYVLLLDILIERKFQIELTGFSKCLYDWFSLRQIEKVLSNWKLGLMEIFLIVSTLGCVACAFYAMALAEHQDDKFDIKDYLLIQNKHFMLMKSIFIVAMTCFMHCLVALYTWMAIRWNKLRDPQMATSQYMGQKGALSLDDLMHDQDEVLIPEGMPIIYHIPYIKFPSNE